MQISNRSVRHSGFLMVSLIIMTGCLLLITACGDGRKTSEIRKEARLVDVSNVSVDSGGGGQSAEKGRLEKDLRILQSLSRALSGMEREMIGLQQSVGLKERGHYTAEEHDAIVGLLFRYLVCREALWDLLAFYSDERENFEEPDDQVRGFVLGLGAALNLQAYGSRLVETFLEEPEVIAKLNEGNFRYNIPEDVYDTLLKSVTSIEHQEALRTAWALFTDELFDESTALYSLYEQDPEYRDLIDNCRKLYNIGIARMENILEARSLLLPDIRNRLRHNSIITLAKKAKEDFGRNLFAAQGVLFSNVSDLKNPLSFVIYFSDEQKEKIHALLQPGDIILTFTGGYMSNIFLPGVFKHGITYIGSPEDREVLDLDKLPSDLPEAARIRYLEDLNCTALPDGQQADLIEAVAEGVIFNSIDQILDSHINRLLILRPVISEEERAAQLQRVFELRGDDYDYDFDFNDASSQCCTEVIYRSLNTKGNIKLELVPRFGRQTLSADDIIHNFLRSNEPAFQPVLLAEEDLEGQNYEALLLEGEAIRSRLLALTKGEL